MKIFSAIFLSIVSLSAAAESEPKLPSCNLEQQRMVRGETGGSITDPLQAHISVRANALTADVGTARKARIISQQKTDSLVKRIAKVRSQTEKFVHNQGFLSAAERASFDRELDAIAKQICTPRHSG